MRSIAHVLGDFVGEEFIFTRPVILFIFASFEPSANLNNLQ